LKMDKELSVEEILIKGAEQLGLSLSKSQTEKFITYLRDLKAWNKRFNLTALKKDTEIIVKHFLDSLTLCQLFRQVPKNLVDIGPGAGFPSLPIKIYLTDIECTLIEANGKKISFLKYIIHRLNLKGVFLIKARAEEMARGDLRERFDLAVGRGVARLNVLLEYALPYVKIGGCMIAQKGKNFQEIEEAQKALSLLGGRVTWIKSLKLPFSGEHRNLIMIEKVKSTPLTYPRRPGIPEKRPL